MSPRLNDPRYASISRPSGDALALLRQVQRDCAAPIVAEIGVGIGATTAELARLMDNRGELHLFDYVNTLDSLMGELAEAGCRIAVPHPNGRKIFESYNWTLALLLRKMRAAGGNGLFDLAYLDGAHTWQHDAPAALALARLLKPGGILLLDDFGWTLANSPTLNPERQPATAANYSEAQIAMPHIALICEVFLDHDEELERLPLPLPLPAGKGLPLRRAYRRRMNWAWD